MEDDAVDYVRQVLEAYDSCTKGMQFISILRWVEHVFFLVFPTEQLWYPFNLFSPFSCCISNLRPHPHVSGHSGNGDFFLRFSLKRRFRAAKMQVSKYGAQSGGFENASFSFTG